MTEEQCWIMLVFSMSRISTAVLFRCKRGVTWYRVFDVKVVTDSENKSVHFLNPS